MSNCKPYFKHIWELNKKILIVLPFVLCINIASSVWGTLKMAENYNESIIFSSQSIPFSILIITLAGLFYSLKLFSHSMSIRADRLGFIKASLIWGIILGIGLGVFGLIIDSGCKMFIEVYTGRSVQIYSQINWINNGAYEFGTSLISRIFNNLILFSTGFMLGAIWYRLKVKYSVLIFVVLPIASISYLANYGFRNPAKVEEVGTKILSVFEYLMVNQHISNSLKVVGVIIFTIVGARLLIKAPIKEYANDLI
ncbi:MAG: hypothetical protein ACRDA3_11420 [Peptostreptococcaceae bacterium]